MQRGGSEWLRPSPPPISETTYTYDGMVRVTEMRYPNGWVEYDSYDKMGRILAVDDTHPSEKPAEDIHTSLSKCPSRQVASIRILNKREEKYI